VFAGVFAYWASGGADVLMDPTGTPRKPDIAEYLSPSGSVSNSDLPL
jgi:hypothetical protein